MKNSLHFLFPRTDIFIVWSHQRLATDRRCKFGRTMPSSRNTSLMRKVYPLTRLLRWHIGRRRLFVWVRRLFPECRTILTGLEQSHIGRRQEVAGCEEIFAAFSLSDKTFRHRRKRTDSISQSLSWTEKAKGALPFISTESAVPPTKITPPQPKFAIQSLRYADPSAIFSPHRPESAVPRTESALLSRKSTPPHPESAIHSTRSAVLPTARPMIHTWQLRWDCMTTAMRLHGNCDEIEWQLRWDWMATAMRSHDNCDEIEWQLRWDKAKGDKTDSLPQATEQ